MLVLVLDMAINFLKGYYAYGKGKVVEDPIKIAKHYLTTQFPIDFIVVVIYIIPRIHQSLALNFLQLIPATLIWIKKFQYQDDI